MNIQVNNILHCTAFNVMDLEQILQVQRQELFDIKLNPVAQKKLDEVYYLLGPLINLKAIDLPELYYLKEKGNESLKDLLIKNVLDESQIKNLVDKIKLTILLDRRNQLRQKYSLKKEDKGHYSARTLDEIHAGIEDSLAGRTSSLGSFAQYTDEDVNTAIGLEMISVRLYKELIEDLKILAHEDGINYYAYIRLILMRHVVHKRIKKKAL